MGEGAARVLTDEGELGVEAGKVTATGFEGGAKPSQLRLGIRDFAGDAVALGAVIAQNQRGFHP